MWVPRAGTIPRRRFRVWRQPLAGPLLDLIDTGRWPNVSVTGSTQTGKTLTAFVLPTLYHLFELGETVVVGVPDLNMAADKWTEDIKPVIEASPELRRLLPTKGPGSRGGRNLTAIHFRHGVTLRFMTAGSRDKAVAGFTTRVVAQTEIDGYAGLTADSVETDRVSQIDARTMRFRPYHRHYHESTPSTPDGRIWREYLEGTRHRLCLPCPSCGAWVTPEREHVVGWRDADNALQAAEETRVACPACGDLWDEEARRRANEGCVAVPRGQEIDEHGEVTGPEPVTDLLSYRWNSLNNLFVPIGQLGAEEWKAQRSVDEEAADRKLKQFWYARPARVGASSLVALTADGLTKRAAPVGRRRGLVPEGYTALGLGCDVGKHLLYWTVVAMLPDDLGGGGHVVDYGRLETGAGDVPEQRAIHAALGALQRRAAEGWALPIEDRDKAEPTFGRASPDWSFVDVGYQHEVVHLACANADPLTWMPAKGLGWQQRKAGEGGGRYRRPAKVAGSVVLLGDRWHLVRAPGTALGYEARLDADGWKSWLHDRLSLESDRPGAVTVYRAPNRTDHLPFMRHLTAEEQVVEVKPGVGEVRTWRNPTGKNNHWLDATCLAFAAAHFSLAWSAAEAASGRAKAAMRSGEGRYAKLPDGRPFLATRREKNQRPG